MSTRTKAPLAIINYENTDEKLISPEMNRKEKHIRKKYENGYLRYHINIVFSARAQGLWWLVISPIPLK
jgi:hypothetical protein